MESLGYRRKFTGTFVTVNGQTVPVWEWFHKLD